MEAITKGPVLVMESCYMHICLIVKNPRARNLGTTVVTMIKRKLDVQLNSEKHGKFQVSIWNSVEKKNPDMSYSKESKGT
jgi:hypothetical protein